MLSRSQATALVPDAGRRTPDEQSETLRVRVGNPPEVGRETKLTGKIRSIPPAGLRSSCSVLIGGS